MSNARPRTVSGHERVAARDGPAAAGRGGAAPPAEPGARALVAAVGGPLLVVGPEAVLQRGAEAGEAVAETAAGWLMASQIDHLVAMSERPDISILVLPFSAGAHPALAGPFIHLEFPDDNDPDVIFVENTLGDTLFRDDAATTARYREQFWKLESMATAPDDFEAVARSIAR